MRAIHVIMETSTSSNPHHAPNEHIESIATKRKLSAITFLVFGVLLLISGSLLASFENQRYSVSFIIFGILGIIFAFMYWISAERILIGLQKLDAQRTRQIQNSSAITSRNMNNSEFDALHITLPSYDQSISPPIEIPPPYEEAIKIKSINPTDNNTSQPSSSLPIHSISLSIDQATNTSREMSSRKPTTSQ